jgi:hypothetical protein
LIGIIVQIAGGAAALELNFSPFSEQPQPRNRFTVGFEQIHHRLEDCELCGFQRHFAFWRLVISSERRGAERGGNDCDCNECCMVYFHSAVLGHGHCWAIEAFILVPN